MNTETVVGIVALSALYYFSLEKPSLPITPPTLVLPGVIDISDKEKAEAEAKAKAAAEAAASQAAEAKAKAAKPKSLDRKVLPQWAQTLFDINIVARDLITDLVLAKIAGSLLNESGLRKTVAEHRANVSLQKKKEITEKKLIILQEKQAKLLTIKEKFGNLSTISALQTKLKRIEEVTRVIAGEKAVIKEQSKNKASLYIKAEADKFRMQKENVTKANLISKTPSSKLTLSVFKQKVQTHFAKVMNNARGYLGKQKAILILPKITTRTAIHSSASLLGLVIGAYDLIRMFDPKLDPFYKKPGAPAPVAEEFSYGVAPDSIQYNLPDCQEILETGQANGSVALLCKENRKKQWETLSYNGLTYNSPCAVGFKELQWGSYRRCVLTGQYGMEEVQGRYWKDNDNIFETDRLDRNKPSLAASVPDSFYVGLGLRQFYDSIQSLTDSSGKYTGTIDLNNTIEGRGNFAYGPAVGEGAVAPPTVEAPQYYDKYAEGVSYRDEQIKREFEPERFKNYTGPKPVSGQTNLLPGTGDNADPDWYATQFPNSDAWGTGSLEINTLTRNLSEYGAPYTNVGVSFRGGWDLTDRQRLIQLYPNATELEIDSALEAGNP